MLVARAHKIAVSVVFVLLAAWLLVGSLLVPPNQRAIESGSYGTQESGRKIAMPNSAEDRIADYTWWLSAFTLALVVVSAVQIRFLIRADKTARIAAEAAVKSASAATAIEFPIVRTSWIGPEVTSTDELVRPHVPYAGAVNYGWPTRFSAISEIESRNYGRTPAFPTRITLGFAVTKMLPEVPVYSKTGRCEPNTVIEGRNDYSIETHFGFELTDDQIKALKESAAVLWFYGLLNFHDVMDRPHETAFCWQWGQQSEADSMFYFFDDGSAPPAYTRKT